MRKPLYIAMLLACLFPGFALAESKDKDLELPSDNRIKLLMYDESDVYTITTRYGYQTNIVFAPEEEIQTISVGDRSLWQIIPSNNRLFIRPMEEDVITNMTILTNKRSYQFDLKSVGSEKKDGVIYVAKFTYPQPAPKPVYMESPPVVAPFMAGPSITPSAAPVMMPSAVIPAPHTDPVYQAPAPAADTSEPMHPNYNYTYAGPDELAPLQVYDDGKSTFIKYREIGQLPAAFVMNANGDEMPVTSYAKDDFMIIDAVAPEISLKSAGGTVHVYNEMLSLK